MKSDYDANKFVADTLASTFPEWILAAEAIPDENYKVNDIQFTASTKGFPVIYCENKRIMGGYHLKEDGEFRDYFRRDIYRKLKFENQTVTSGTPVYFVNAEDRYGNMDNGKYRKILDENACLSFLSPDGILIYSCKTLREAFIGYADYYVSHTSEFGRNWEGKRWEKKAVIDLTKGCFIPCSPPSELFEKR